jgi:hypothetical protein
MPNAGLFGSFDVRIDPWQAEYGAELAVDMATVDESDVAVTLDVERTSSMWQPILPATLARTEALVFVDGVRRVEARLIVRRDGRLFHGALGSYGVGAVLAAAGARAVWGSETIGRIAVLGGGEILPGPVSLGDALTYEPLSTSDQDPDAPLRAVHLAMRAAEERFGRELAAAGAGVVIADGPLNFGDTGRGAALGFVKRLFKLYVGEEQRPVLERLEPGQRTPVFGLRYEARFDRLSWFVRLGPRLGVDSSLTGLARLEVAAAVGKDEAIRLADLTASILPTFVPSRARDGRAPQNLAPIGALESHLRHRLGDVRLIRRRLSAVIAQELRSA